MKITKTIKIIGGGAGGREVREGLGGKGYEKGEEDWKRGGVKRGEEDLKRGRRIGRRRKRRRRVQPWPH